MSTRWLRLYEDLVDDPKVQMLSDRTFRGLINLWCLASRNNGVLPRLPQMAFSLRVKPETVERLVAELLDADLLDHYDDGTLCPHNWMGRQFKSDVSNERVKRLRQRRRNGVGNVTPTVTATPPETDTDTESETDSSLRSLNARELRAEFDGQFWPAYPHKVGKPAAFKAFCAVRKTNDLSAILFGLDRYAGEKPADRAWLNPATFLNQERFNDEPASTPVTNGKHNAHDALLTEVARQFAPRHGHDERAADPDGGLFDQPGTAPGDRARTVELPPDAYRRSR